MRPYLPAIVALASVSSFAFTASAKDSDCPAGAWFCATEEGEVVEETTVETALPPPPIQVSRPVVVVQPNVPVAPPPPPPIVIIIMPQGQMPAATPPPPPIRVPRTVGTPHVAPRKFTRPKPPLRRTPPAPAWKREVGFDIHVQRLGYHMGTVASIAPPDASQVGGGAALRIHVNPKTEFDLGNECFFGKDFNGLERGEIGMTAMGVRHFNPDSRLRFYGLGGGTFWFGSVYSKKQGPLTPVEDAHYGKFYASYGAFALQAGLGTELRISEMFSFHVDVLAAARWRFAASENAPEYYDPHTGEAKILVPGVLLRGGLTFWPPDKKKR